MLHSSYLHYSTVQYKIIPISQVFSYILIFEEVFATETLSTLSACKRFFSSVNSHVII